MREFYCGEEQIYIDTLVLKVSRPAKHITFQKKKNKKKKKKRKEKKEFIGSFSL